MTRGSSYKDKQAEKTEAVAAIGEAYSRYGDQGVAALREQSYPNIPKATWHRWVTEAREPKMMPAARAAREAARHLPAAPSPDYIASKPGEARKNLDFLTRLEDLYQDAEKLRRFSLKEDGEGIKNAAFFAKSITLRRDLLETALRAMGEVWDLRRMQHFYDTVLEEIAKESPDAAKRILDRLQELNAETGMTYAEARV